MKEVYEANLAEGTVFSPEADSILAQRAQTGKQQIAFNSLLRKGYLYNSMHVTGNLTRSISPARRVAWEVLEAVEGGAYASDALRDSTRPLDSRDAGLASQIVFGCLRMRAQLDYLITYYSRRGFEQLDQAVVLPLRMGIFQLRYLERIPSHAAVHETVETVKTRRRAAAGLVNAVLRKVDRRPVRWPDKPTELSCPGWLLDRWSKHFGPELAEGIARDALLEPPSYVRLRVPPEPFSAESGLEPTSVTGCYRLLAPPTPGTRLHDISSQAILPLLDLQPGHSYLDLCAAPGNKTLQALETPLSLAIACDISYKRLAEVPGHPRQVNNLPTAVALSPDDRYAVLLHSGFGSYTSDRKQSLSVLNLENNELTDFPDDRLAHEARQTYFIGLAFSLDGKHIFASMASLTDPLGKKKGNTGNEYPRRRTTNPGLCYGLRTMDYGLGDFFNLDIPVRIDAQVGGNLQGGAPIICR